MVSLDVVKASNGTLRKELPPQLVAVFVGGTSGIGEITLKALAKQTVRPKVYIVGRSSESAARIIAECRVLNPDGEYIFIQKTLTVLADAEALCDDIKKRETYINLLVLSMGEPILDLTRNSDGLRPLLAVMFFMRFSIAKRLLPLIQAAPALRRIVDVAAGAHEEELLIDDWQAERLSMLEQTKVRGHLATSKTLSWQILAKSAPDVSIVHEFPGFVVTPLFQRVKGVIGFVFRMIAFLFGWLIQVPLDECAERHVFMSTSSAFPPKEGDAKGAPLVAGLEVHSGADGQSGSGVYSVHWDNEGPGKKATELLKKYHDDGSADKLWAWMQGEYARILGAEL